MLSLSDLAREHLALRLDGSLTINYKPNNQRMKLPAGIVCETVLIGVLHHL
jgi:hypothetical protein